MKAWEEAIPVSHAHVQKQRRLGASLMLSAQFIDECIQFAKSYEETQSSVDQDATISSIITASTVSSLGFSRDAASSATHHTPDPLAVSNAEAQSYYAGLHSEPTLLYRTSKKQWSPPSGPEAQRHLKELREVFTHPITKVWNHDLAWKVVKVMDAHTIRFTTIDVVRFKEVGVDEAPEDGEEDEDDETVEAKKPVAGPVTIWIGVFPEFTSATAAHNAAQNVLALLSDYQVTDVDIEYRESFYTREAGPRLLQPVDGLDPLVDVEANVDYVCHPGAPSRDVLLLGKGAFTNLADSIKLMIGRHGIMVKRWRKQIEVFVEREKGTNTINAEKAKEVRIETRGLLDKAENAMEAIGALLNWVNKDWKKLDNRVLGDVLRSPAISLGAGEHRFTEDWGIFKVNRDKLGDGFQGNKLDLGTKLTPDEFTVKCFPRGDANWEFEYPHDRLLPLIGTMTDELMRAPDMWYSDGEPCLLVAKSGNATGTTLGRANGVFSIVRDYFTNLSVNQTSMEWGIINYDSKSEVFSEPGDSGSIIADIRGRIGGMLTGGSGKTKSSDMTYATPFWWLLQRIRTNGFPNAHLNVFT
ncbi:uncharacterized protein EI90DRAFT_3120831 [Cantharellus anzutake]|uniref:uncharacterized protein n=1 Tax=Cantharellus anzutake TaxID=1750568 RepID=UPI001904B80D|nr:uncharacterized protein EI90DRAFT_3120831 [Cantharellus anzutake]KAF8334953.1 hypothetical protein EI90DRAFT_3120831 [Cantharellus anzutake]